MKPHASFHLAGFLTGVLVCSACSSGTGDVIAAPSRDGWQTDAAWPGFTLIAPLSTHDVHLVDMSGTAVHSWEAAGDPGVAIYLTERGTLLRCMEVEDHPVFTGGGQGGWLQEIDWDGSVLWDFRWADEDGMHHHDIEALPDGNVLLIAWDRVTREEALAAGRDPELLEGEEFWPGAVYEIRPTRPEGGEVVWSWHAWDHLVQDFDPEAPNHGAPSAHPERIDINGDRNPDPPSEEEEAAQADQMAALGYGGGAPETEDAEDAEDDPDEPEEEEDPEIAARNERAKGADWMHANGIDYSPELDQIVLSVRRFDEVWIIDHSTTTEEAAGSDGGRSGMGGDLLYRWGNPYAYGMGVFEERRLYGQHHVQWIPEGHLGEGGLIVFNNGTEPREWSTIDEWWAPRDAAGHYPRTEGEPFGPAAPDWTYTAEEPSDFYSSFISGVQRLPNGNTLICSGAQGWVFEVTPDGSIVWDWKNPYGPEPDPEEERDEPDDVPKNSLFRAERFAADHPGIVALREKGAPIPLDPGPGPATNQRVDPEPMEDPVEQDALDHAAEEETTDR